MECTLDLAKEISKTIKESKCYKEYCDALEKLKKDKELFERVCAFKKNSREFNRFSADGGSDFDREKYLSQEYHKLCLLPQAKAVLENEKQLIHILGLVFFEVTSGVELEGFEAGR